MATLLDDLDKYYDPDLYLPIRGVVYRIAAPAIAEADRVRDLIWSTELNAKSEHEEIVKILGDAYVEMGGNDVPAPFVSHAGRTAIIHFGASPDMGRAHWRFAHLTSSIDLGMLSKLTSTPGDTAETEA